METSALLTWPRIALCLGWDVISAAIVATIIIVLTAPLITRLPRAAAAVSAVTLALYAIFLLISYQVALIVGAPLDKAAIDLLFLNNATSAGRGTPLTDSLASYVTPAVWFEGAAAVGLATVVFFWLWRRPQIDRVLTRRGVAALATSILLTLEVIPAIANGPIDVHTLGLERSPLTMLAVSYLRGPLRAWRRCTCRSSSAGRSWPRPPARSRSRPDTSTSRRRCSASWTSNHRRR